MTDEAFAEDPVTSAGKIRTAAVPSLTPVAVTDEAHAIGQLMGAVARLERKVDSLTTEVSVLTREAHALRRDVEVDRGDLVAGASRHAARRTGNRVAVIMGAIFTLWEVSAPVIHQLAALVQQWGHHR